MVEAGEWMRDAVAEAGRMESHMGEGCGVQANKDKGGGGDAAHRGEHALPRVRIGCVVPARYFPIVGASKSMSSRLAPLHLDIHLTVLHHGLVRLDRLHGRWRDHLAGADVELPVVEVAFHHVAL